MKVLLVAPDFPYPATHGGRVEVLRRIEAINQLGFELDLAVCCKQLPDAKSEDYIKSLVTNLFVVQRTNTIWDSLKLIPYQAQSRKALAEITLNKKYDWVILEGEYVMTVLDNPTINYKSILLRVHNIEFKYYYQLFLSSSFHLKNFYYLLEAVKFYFYSKKAFKIATKLAFISIDELNWYKSKYPGEQKGFLLQSTFDRSKFIPYQSKANNKTVLFIGSLFMPNNINGLDWYINKVHPLLLKHPDYNLIIVGSTANNKNLALQLQKKFKAIKKVDIMCDVEDISPFYSQASVFINPMLKGAGIKIKTINAIQNGLPVVSTVTGSEGTGLLNNKHVFINDSPILFYKNILKFLEEPALAASMVAESQSYLKQIDNKTMIDLFNN